MKTAPTNPKTDIINKIKDLYAKNKTVMKTLDNPGDAKVYSESDGVPLSENSIIKQILDVPCLPFNKVVQIAGKPDTGKSTTGGETMAAAQRAGFDVIVWDSEDKLDLNRYDNEFKGDSTKLYIIKTNEIRIGGQLMKDYVTAIKEANPKAKLLLVWDSVGASMSRSETERNLTDERHGQPGQDAKEVGQVIRHWVGMCNKYTDSIAILLINQTYAKIGFMQHGDQAKGGSGIEYLSSAIIYLKKIKTDIKVENKKKIKTGITTKATASKNHLTQNKKSTYQMDFKITAEGTQIADTLSEDEESEC